jgi:hypothetical protein
MNGIVLKRLEELLHHGVVVAVGKSLLMVPLVRHIEQRSRERLVG